jgi:large subunit ribosomal protein L4
MLGSVTLRAQLRPAPLAAAAPARAGAVSLRAAPRCMAYSPVSAERLPPSQVRKVSFDGAAAGEATLALKTAKEATAVGLVHRYLVLVRQNARRVRA